MYEVAFQAIHGYFTKLQWKHLFVCLFSGPATLQKSSKVEDPQFFDEIADYHLWEIPHSWKRPRKPAFLELLSWRASITVFPRL